MVDSYAHRAVPEPVKTRTAAWDALTENQRKAAQEAAYGLDQTLDPAAFNYRIETYRTKDIVKIIEGWGWSATIRELTQDHHDIDRVKHIMRLVPKEGQWPYVSYFARTIQDLATPDPEQADEDCPDGWVRHGDGWHRIVAANELGLPTVEILYPLDGP